MISRVKKLGGGFLGSIGYLAVLVIPLLLFQGATWASSKLLPWFFFASGISFLLLCLVLLPLLVFRSLRASLARAIFGISYVFGTTLWMWSLLLTIKLWGVGWAIFGLLFAGIGVLPMAFLATAFKGLWSVFSSLIFLSVMSFGSRMFAFWIAAKLDEYIYRNSIQDETIDIDLEQNGDEGVNQTNTAEAYRIQAEDGDADSQNELGWCYMCGHGVTQDVEKAFHWWERAAFQGHTEAQYSIAGCYESGDGVGLDYREAFVWYGLCEEQKGPKAGAKMAKIASQFSNDELINCRERLRLLKIKFMESEPTDNPKN